MQDFVHPSSNSDVISGSAFRDEEIKQKIDSLHLQCSYDAHVYS